MNFSTLKKQSSFSSISIPITIMKQQALIPRRIIIDQFQMALLYKKRINSYILIIFWMKEFYKVPDAEHRKIALGSLPGAPYRIKKALESIKNMFEPMDKPVQGQWLWQHEEEGQSFDAYLNQKHKVVDQKKNIICIKPLEKISQDFLFQIAKFCQYFFYPMKVVVEEPLKSTKNITQRINEHTGKNQFNARDILKVLRDSIPAKAFCRIGVSVTDLYPKEEWNFVFGLASISERTGVFSFARYDQRFFGQKAYETDYNLIKYRSIGVMAHEITHMFGVRHCVHYKCLMNGSNHLEETQKKPLYLCVICLRKLQSNIKFDIYERYQKLRQYYELQKDNRVERPLAFVTEAIKNIQENMKV